MKIKNKIKIKVNGKIMLFNESILLSELIKNLIEKLKLPIKKIAIELNRQIVDKKRLSKIFLKSGDKVEIVNFIGGG